ncbi:SusC/RagA family TonB-linked outer membrane protein [Chitinophaga polysaccharea]|uniref:SusC/RagA family TonB-linked outer membrane protein n=1 Tax=Chitinophaga polysaccharea TaxID=1293035 RepID=UPI001455112E|nr:SusC/RagA family TonB-linked outer membrane protein [Chitinophaga polysaccharea]NLR60953.1 SusC/RagA family TonB-linked outer membrane protein [Chitinophaga polysaccharea]
MIFNVRTEGRVNALLPAFNTRPGIFNFRMITKLMIVCFVFFFHAHGIAATSTAANLRGTITPADSISVSGTVTDSLGHPIPGVVVRVVGTAHAIPTDANGYYHFKQVTKGALLSFSMMGYAPQQVIANSNQVNVRLQQAVRTLDEIIITDPYRTTTRATNASAIGSIRGNALENKPFSSFMQAMQGQVAGVVAPLTSGQPGANVNIRIRGVGSLSLSSDPLIVVDGMIVNSGSLSGAVTTSNALAGINQNDIESIDVLKDAAATALYGSRGATGVIVITTKRGKLGKTQVRIDAEGGNTSPIGLPHAGQPLNASQYAELFKEALSNSGYTEAQVKDAADKYGLNSGKSNNWYDLVTRNGRQQQYNVSINGGTEKTKLFASAGYFDQQATTIGADFKRISGLFNFDHQINKRIQLSAGINFSNVDQNTPYSSNYSGNPTYAARILRPYQLAYNDDGSINTSTAGNINFPGVYNPLWIAQYDNKHLSETRVLGNTRLKWNIWDKLTYTSYYSIDYNLLEETMFLNATMGDGVSSGGTSKNYYTRYFNWLTRNQLDYRYDIPGYDNFYVTAAVGYEAQKSKKYLLAAVGTGFPSSHEDLTALSNAATPTGAYGQTSNYAFTSMYSNAGVNYQNKYALNASFRRDGSSRFPANHRNASFYSIGGTWNVQEENFFRQQHILSSLKLRSSYGTTGNANLGNYDWMPQVSYSSTYSYAGYNGSQYSVIGNTDLRWETSKKFDAGTDIGFMADRFILTVDYYYNNIDGLIRSVPTSLSTGFGSVSQNVGAMANKGWEFTIKGDVVKLRNFNWYSNFNLSLNKNVITRLPKNTNERNDQFYLKEGYSFNTYYMKEFAGVDTQTGSPLYYTDGGHGTTTTDISKAAYVVLNRQSVPKATGGFSNVFTYKGISLGVDINYNLGYWVYGASDIYFTSGAYYTYNKYQFIYDRRWTTPGQQTDVPKYSTTTDNSTSTYRLYRGDHIRLQNLSIGYDFKNIPVAKRLGVSKLHVYARGTNLFLKTFDSRLPFDPEVNYSGYDYQNMLKYKTYTLGINVGL